MPATKKPQYVLEIETPSNGRMGTSTVNILDVNDNDRVILSEHFDLRSGKLRDKATRELAAQLDCDESSLRKDLERAWTEKVSEHRRRRAQAEAGSPEGADVVELTILDERPETMTRPLCCIAGHGYAAAWLNVQETTKRGTDPQSGAAVMYETPLVKTRVVRAIIRDDGKAYADVALRGFEPETQLGFEVRLPVRPQDKKTWSGAGVNRYIAGERPKPGQVFNDVAKVVDRFIDFSKSLSTQTVMCEFVACYVMATYLLDAFNVTGYLWPNGEPGSGKSTFLDVIAEMAYLGQVVLSSSSLASLRDMSDYGGTLAFDDAEKVMDVRQTDPGKRELLLAGNRRGAVIAVKEQVGETWVTRYVNTFCPRLFSAIKLPDEVLGSRTIIVPLVRSSDRTRANANPQDHSLWPLSQRRLTDDLWAVGLANVSSLREFDHKVASASTLAGRDLDVWRAVFAVALWLDQKHGVEGLSARMNELARNYQAERSGLNPFDPVRVAIRALDLMIIGTGEVEFSTEDLTDLMNKIAVEEGIVEETPEEEEQEKKSAKFTNTRKVGRMLARQRFKKAVHTNKRRWKATRLDVEALARAYSVELSVPC